ncbi:hypothetical protein [Metallococcus carri]|uniref:hypothetical protein n=1 Tax=Metallococcus carri TaxID=1656884 RepID=UPI00140D36FB|nr:hypothetical protein [Metallococcus carri]
MRAKAVTYRGRYASVLREVGVPEPFDVDLFCANVAAQRGRRVQLHELPVGIGRVCGLYVSLPAVDHVYYATGTSPRHQQHIIEHELMHLLFEHGGLRGFSTDVLERLLPGLDPGLVRAALARGGYSDPEEREAETLASLVMDHARGAPPGMGGDPVAARIETAFG